MFAGQHYWYDVEGTENDIPCRKCHVDIYAEMESHVGPHSGETYIAIFSTNEHKSMGNFPCSYCHSWYFSEGDTASVKGSSVIPGEEAHAASTVKCIECHIGQKEVYNNYESYDPNWGIAHFGGKSYHEEYCYAGHSCVGGGCHNNPTEVDEYPEHGTDLKGTITVDGQDVIDGNCKRCHCQLEPGGEKGDWEDYKVYHVPPAGGFGITYFNETGAYGWDTGSKSAHMSFINDSIEHDTLKGSNEACIACHTGIAVEIDWTHSSDLEFDVSYRDKETHESGAHNWTTQDWKANGTKTITSYGNTTGSAKTETWNGWPGEVPGADYDYSD